MSRQPCLTFVSLVVYFHVDIPDKEDYRVNWREIEYHVSENFEKLRMIYARGGKKDGHLVFSSRRLDQEQFDTLTKSYEVLIEDRGAKRKFTFELCSEENLPIFWKEYEKHYDFCIANNVRFGKSRPAKRNE